jgi:hypothetical protein
MALERYARYETGATHIYQVPLSRTRQSFISSSYTPSRRVAYAQGYIIFVGF